jgi:hypothetical protein
MHSERGAPPGPAHLRPRQRMSAPRASRYGNARARTEVILT